VQVLGQEANQRVKDEKMKSYQLESIFQYLSKNSKVECGEDGILTCEIPHFTSGMKANAYCFGHPEWGRAYFKKIHRHETFKVRWQKAIGSWDDKIVVDIGCGPGNIYATVGGSPRLLIGVDISRGALEMAQQIGYVPILGDAHNLPFVDNFADLVVANATLHHCDDMARVLAEAARLVRPGGLLVTDRDPQASAWNFKGLGLLGRKVQWTPFYRLVSGRLHTKTDETLARQATEIHNTFPGDGVTAELYYQVLQPLGFTVQLFPHNHNMGVEVLDGKHGRAPWRVRLCQRLSGIDPDSKSAAQSIMCIARRVLL